jgi:aldose 1-epimerase
MHKLTHVLLTNRNNMQVELVDFGARIVSIKVPSRSGKIVETTLSDRTSAEIIGNVGYKGATCGRIANRISRAQFIIDEQLFRLTPNEGENMLHGGHDGFSRRFWQLASHRKTYAADTAVFELVSENMEQGFPGRVVAKVSYILNCHNHLRIVFEAFSDTLTPINMCNHTYFTLGEPNIHELILKVQANKYLTIDAQSLPTGQFSSVTTLVDLRHHTKINHFINRSPLDHCYVLHHEYSPVAVLSSMKHGIKLSIHTNQPGLQVYTGNYLPHRHGAIALEAQGFPDAVNHPSLTTDWASPQKHYSRFVSYQFDNF